MTLLMNRSRYMPAMRHRLLSSALGQRRAFLQFSALTDISQRTCGDRSLLVVRASSGSSGPEKSWAEIASDAAELAKSAAVKVQRGVSSAIEDLSSKLATRQQRAAGRTEVIDPVKEEQEQLYQRGVEIGKEIFGNNFLGRSLGGMLGNAFRNMQTSTNENVLEIAAQAQELIGKDRQVLRALGGACEVGDPEEASQSMGIMNGDVMQQLEMQMPIIGRNGKVAMAQVEFLERDSQVQRVSIQVVTEDGQKIDVEVDSSAFSNSSRSSGGDGSSSSQFSQSSSKSSPAQQTIDVDWREVK